MNTFNQESMNYNQCYKTKMTSWRSEQAVTDTTRKINHDKII